MENNIKKKFFNLKIDLIKENKLNYGKTILGKKAIGYKNNRFLNTDIFIKYKNKTDYYNKLRFKNLNLNVSQKDKNLAKKNFIFI